MKKKQENGTGEPGQFKTTPVVGFTTVDHTPTPPPKEKNSKPLKRIHTAASSAEKKQLKRVLKHHRKGIED